MKLTIYATGALAFLWPAVSSAQNPSSEGFILFDSNCNVQATSLTIDLKGIPSNQTVPVVFHLVDGGCRGNPKVAVGKFGRKKKFYELLTNCTFQNLRDQKPIVCELKRTCPGKDYSYSYGVCVDGKVVIDPELRIKGGNRPDCPVLTTQEAKQKCINGSQP